jgi:hypothetical protein
MISETCPSPFDDVELCARNVLTELHRMLNPDVAIVRAVPDRDRDADLIKFELPDAFQKAASTNLLEQLSGGASHHCGEERLIIIIV